MSGYKYLANGQAVRVVRTFDDGAAIVQRWYEYETQDDIGDECFVEVEGQPYYLESGKFFDKPPLLKLHERAEALRENINDLEQKRNDLQKQCNTLIAQASEHDRLLKRVKNHSEALQRIDDYMNLRITHVVVFHHGQPRRPEIVAAGERQSRCGSDDRSTKLKLLSFAAQMPRQHQDDSQSVGWRLYGYSDGSGGDKDCVPCTSIEEASAVVSRHLSKILADAKLSHYPNWLHDQCVQFDVEMPPAFLIEYEAKKAGIKEKEREKLEAEQLKIEKKLQELDA